MAPMTAPTFRLAAVVALTVLAAALAAGPVAAQDYPPEPEITVTTPGATIVIEGTNWGPGTQVRITFNNPSGQSFSVMAAADENGAIWTDVPIPDDTEPGTLSVAFNGTGADGNPREDQGTVQVVSPDANAPDGARSPGVAGSPDSATDSSNGAGSSNGNDSSGATGSSAAGASDQVTSRQASARPANATVPATSSQSPAILLAVALMGAGVVSLFAARRACARRSAQ